jgi:hypothetical protein
MITGMMPPAEVVPRSPALPWREEAVAEGFSELKPKMLTLLRRRI